MKFVYCDGGRSKYFKAENVGDCVTRAIANATGIDYKVIYDRLKELSEKESVKHHRGHKQSSVRDGVFKETWKKYLTGDFHILNGIAQKIDIYSKGKDLNMYMTGAYNFSNAIADMRIFGSLSKSISNVFSKIKNASLNTLLNTIPGINSNENNLKFQKEISKIPNEKNQSSRIFTVDIYGDINGSNYVKSFKWIK
jgi:hypothetical protein